MRSKVNSFWIVIACIISFILGVFVNRTHLIALNDQTNSVNTPSATKSILSFNIPQVPLPPGWSSKENLAGNSFATSLPLNPGIKTQGTLNTDNAIDYYVFTTNNPSQIVVDVTEVPKALYWILYDNQYKEVASAFRTGTSEGSTKITLQNPGKYYVKVWADYGEVTNYPYTIRLSILPFFE